MKKSYLYLIIILSLFFEKVSAQVLLDSVSLSAQKTFHNLTAALQHPDSVYKLDLSKKKLKEVPVELKAFKNLQVLNLSRNKLQEIPGWIGNFHNLQKLQLNNNKLKGLPDSIGNLENLVFLGLNRNLIEKLPHEMGKLKNLEVLEMWDNELDAVPEEMKNLKNLKVFELRGILFSEEEQKQISELMPDAIIYFSPSCNCKN